MTTIIGTSDCNKLAAGEGLATKWTLSGSTTAYTGPVDTDGYKVKATLTWANGLGNSKKSTKETIDDTTKIGYGTCVATLDANGKVPDKASTTHGNFALCHFFFYTAKTTGTESGTVEKPHGDSTAWGVSKYLTAKEWGETTPGSGIVGKTMNTSTGGAAITTNSNGMAYTPTTAKNSKLKAGDYSMEWLQPKYAETYKENVLRRYDAPHNNTTPDKVKGYCISQRRLDGDANFADGIVAGTEATLSGAFSLAAGAIAFGVAALAI